MQGGGWGQETAAPCDTSEHPPLSDCLELQKAGQLTPGEYHIDPSGQRDMSQAFPVYCEDGWTYVLRRGQHGNPEDFFQRNWESYEQGFGQAEKEFWIGLENLDRMMKVGWFEMKVDLRDVRNTFRSGLYASFAIEGRDENYRVHLGNFSSHTNWELLDSLSKKASHQEFSTEDVDHDTNFDGSCAQSAKGGGWFSKCYQANLFGHNYNSQHGDQGSGIFWYHFHGLSNSLQGLDMAIRPVLKKKTAPVICYSLSNDKTRWIKRTESIHLYGDLVEIVPVGGKMWILYFEGTDRVISELMSTSNIAPGPPLDQVNLPPHVSQGCCISATTITDTLIFITFNHYWTTETVSVLFDFVTGYPIPLSNPQPLLHLDFVEYVVLNDGTPLVLGFPVCGNKFLVYAMTTDSWTDQEFQVNICSLSDTLTVGNKVYLLVKLIKLVIFDPNQSSWTEVDIGAVPNRFQGLFIMEHSYGTGSHCVEPLKAPSGSGLKLHHWNGKPVPIGELGNAFLEDPGLELGPCFGRSSIEYQPIPDCSAALVLVEDQTFHHQGNLSTQFFFNITAQKDDHDLFMNVLLSHEVHFDLIDFQNHVEGTPGPNARSLRLRMTKMTVEQLNYLSFTVRYPMDGRNDICIYSARCSLNQSDLEVTNTTEDGTLDLTAPMKFQSRLQYRCGNSSMFDIHGNGSHYQPSLTTTCERDGTWNLTGPLPNCVYTGCSTAPVPPPANSLRMLIGTLGPFTINDTLEYVCQDGRKFRDNFLGTKVVATCLMGNSWDVPIWPECLETVHCSPPPQPPPNGKAKVLSTGHYFSNECPGDHGPEPLEHIGCLNPTIQIASNRTERGKFIKTYIIDMVDLDESHENLAALMTFMRDIEDEEQILVSGWGTTLWNLGSMDTVVEMMTGFEDSFSPGNHQIFLRLETKVNSAMPCLQQMVCSICKNQDDCRRKVEQLDVFSTHDLSRYGSLIEYSCPLGQMFATNVGVVHSQSMNCGWDQEWSPTGDLQSCVVVGCVHPPMPDPSFHLIHENISMAKIWPFGASITFSCPQGLHFLPIGSESSFSMTCHIRGTWTNPLSWPTCVDESSASCPTPSEPPVNGLSSWSSGHPGYLGNIVTYSCHPGYMFRDITNQYFEEQVRTCGPDGNWGPQGQLNECVQVGCAPAPKVRRANFLHPRGYLVFYETATYECEQGYYNIEDEDTRRFTLQCQNDGSYNFSSNVPICASYQFCVEPLPKAPSGGFRHWNGDKHYLAEATFTCAPYREFHDPYFPNLPEVMTSVCQWDGRWTINFIPDCRALMRRFAQLPLSLEAPEDYEVNKRELFIDGMMQDSLDLLVTDNHGQAVFELKFQPKNQTYHMESLHYVRPEVIYSGVKDQDLFTLRIGHHELPSYHVFDVFINHKFSSNLQVPKTVSLMIIQKITVSGNSSVKFVGLTKAGVDPMVAVGTNLRYSCPQGMVINGTRDTFLELPCRGDGVIPNPESWPICITPFVNSNGESSQPGNELGGPSLGGGNNTDWLGASAGDIDAGGTRCGTMVGSRQKSKHLGWILIIVPFLVFVQWNGVELRHENTLQNHEDSATSLLKPSFLWQPSQIVPSLPQDLNRSLTFTEIDPDDLPDNIGIYFLETSLGRPQLGLVDECSYESAARFNPQAKIFVLIDQRNHHITQASNLVKRFPNLYFHTFNATKLILSSPMADDIRNVFWHMGSRMMHMSDFFKAVILYLKGGIVTDSDFFSAAEYPLFRDQTSLCAMDFKSAVNPAFMRFQAKHPFMAVVMEEMKESLKNSEFGAVGPMLFSRLMEDQCKVQQSEFQRRHPDVDDDLDRPLVTNPLVNYTFICPKRWNLQVRSLYDKAVIPLIEYAQELGIPPKGKGDYPNLLGLHVQDLPQKLYSSAQEIRDHPGALEIFQELCPLTAGKL
eukprot:snap_masked-scaffold436_size171858-processed-gene-0.19 protein:Tk10500 transcript:snap_masked-scaffold436_size171858-processed-gene-0.19-mRNA-1 annotation:"achain tachylectin 5a from tachypleus tridentatus (japanese horseshoe crab)"